MKKQLLIGVFLFASCIAINSQIEANQNRLNPHQILLPYDRIIQPTGMQIYFGDRSLENHALDAALSPDHKWLAVEERYSIVFISTIDKKVAFTLDISREV